MLAPIVELLPLDSQGRTWPYSVSLSPDFQYPECPRHGAMNCVSPNLLLWRCLTCEIGVEVRRGTWRNDFPPTYQNLVDIVPARNYEV